MGSIWELDFYSRPILDENQKKQWEVLICESPLNADRSVDSLFKYSQFCASNKVNSLWLKEALEKAMTQAEETPKKIRFFRRQMNNMITRACEELGIVAAPSRRTYALNQWLNERIETFYPQQLGYDESALNTGSVQYPESNPIGLPDALRGDKGDRWAFVTLEAQAFAEMPEWEINFGEAFPLSMLNIAPHTPIPGLIIFSSRSIPLAAWMSGLEMSYLHFEEKPRPQLILETGFSDSWILANVSDSQIITEAKNFESAKKQAQQVHFLAVQSSPDSESFAGFWLMQGIE